MELISRSLRRRARRLKRSRQAATRRNADGCFRLMAGDRARTARSVGRRRPCRSERLETVPVGERERSSSSSSRPRVVSNKMGKRQPQRTPRALLGQDGAREQRRRHRPSACSAQRAACRHSAQGTLESKAHTLPPQTDGMEPEVKAAARRCGRTEQEHTGVGASRRSPAFPCHRLSDSSPRTLDRRSPKPEADGLRESDADTDLSESERLPALPSVRVPPQLELRPEVIDAEDRAVQRHRARRQGSGGYDFPDFLPPPFNSWNLRQLAFFYNMEGRGAPRPRPVGSLERYLERLRQLEWHQMQTVQEESGKSAVSDVTHSCHRSGAAASSRLSSPKCILQCQRAFPLTFLSSLVSHSALLSGCACTLCCIRYFTCSTSCCHSAHSHSRQSRISPILERREPVSLPKRSYSESRVHSFERSAESHGFSSPVRTNTHLRRMQASGNIRNPVQGANVKPQPTTRDLNSWDSSGRRGKILDCRTVGARKRSGSEQRRSVVDRQPNGSEKRRSGSECRRRGMERRRTTEFKEVKPDAVTAIMDNLPASKCPSGSRPNRQKQVEFVT